MIIDVSLFSVSIDKLRLQLDKILYKLLENQAIMPIGNTGVYCVHKCID